MRLKFYATLWGVPDAGGSLRGRGPHVRCVSVRGAFAEALAEGPRPLLCLNHDPCLPLDARRLDIWEDVIGLCVAADVADDAVAELATKAWRAGRINGASLSDEVFTEPHFDSNYYRPVRRCVRVVRLIDVCLCVGSYLPGVAATRQYVQVWTETETNNNSAQRRSQLCRL